MADKRVFMVHVGLLLVVFLSYFISINNYFLADDFYLISKLSTMDANQYGVSWTNVIKDLSFSAGGGFYWRPTTTLAFAFNGLLSGLSPIGYHLFNTILLFISSILVYYLSLRFVKHSYAVIPALLFSIYPLHTEAIVLINALADPMGTVLTLGSILFWIKYREENSKSFLLLSLISFGLALLTKEFALVIPGFILVYEMFASGFRSFLKNIKALILPGIFFAVGEAAYLFLRIQLSGSNLSIVTTYPPNIELLKAFATIPFGFSFFPLGINGRNGTILYILLSFIMCILVLLSYLRNKRVVILVGWYVLSFIPVYLFLPSLTNYYLVPHTRFLFLPSVFAIMILVFTLTNLLSKKVLMAFTIFLVCLYSAGLLRSLLVWEQSSKIVKETNQYVYNYLSNTPTKSACVDLSGLYFMNGGTAYFGVNQVGLGLQKPFYDVNVVKYEPQILQIGDRSEGVNNCENMVKFVLEFGEDGKHRFKVVE